MKKLFFFIISVILLSTNMQSQTKINWTDIETAQEIAKTKDGKGKLIFIDCYTDWCGWCKVMDNKTFSDDFIAKLMNFYFISVKFNAEQKADISFNGNIYKYYGNGKRGYNQLASVLLQNKLAFPSFAILNNDLSSKTVLQGYIEKDEFEMIIVYLGEKYDSNLDYNTFKAQYQNEIKPQIIKKINK